MKKKDLKLNKVDLGLGQTLHFRLKQSREGWIAQCEEIKGIITGDINPNPSQEDIVSHIRDAVRVAFNVPAARFPASRLLVESMFTVGELGLTKQYAR